MSEIKELLEKALAIKAKVSPDYSEHTIKLAFDEVMVIIEDVLAYPVDGKTDNPDPPPKDQQHKFNTAGHKCTCGFESAKKEGV